MATDDSVAVYVLDSWPIPEWIQQSEPATSEFDLLLEAALRGKLRLITSRINYGEILSSCRRKFSLNEAARVVADIQTFPIDIISIDDALVDEASQLKVDTAASYADCFAAPLALRYDALIATGDPEFVKFEKLKLRWVGK